MRKHLNIKVSGRVQGVFFRASTQATAAELGVYGFVRNEPDGSVYIEAEAEDTILEKFVDWCRRGPSAAIVDRCEISEANLKMFDQFEVRR